MSGYTTAPQLALQNVAFAYGAWPALQAITTVFETGWSAIVGPNGAGKSTLIRLLANLLTPQSGQVILNGSALPRWPERVRGQQIAWLGQHPQFAAELTVRECVALGRLPHAGLFSAWSQTDQSAIDQALAAFELSAWQTRTMTTLSGGERQRVLLARACAVQAPIVLFDEPTTHLDPQHQVKLLRYLQLARTQQKMIITVLHDLSLALQANQILVLQEGKLRAHGASDDPEIHQQIQSAFAQALHIQQLDNGTYIAYPNFSSTHF